MLEGQGDTEMEEACLSLESFPVQQGRRGKAHLEILVPRGAEHAQPHACNMSFVHTHTFTQVLGTPENLAMC